MRAGFDPFRGLDRFLDALDFPEHLFEPFLVAVLLGDSELLDDLVAQLFNFRLENGNKIFHGVTSRVKASGNGARRRRGSGPTPKFYFCKNMMGSACICTSSESGQGEAGFWHARIVAQNPTQPQPLDEDGAIEHVAVVGGRLELDAGLPPFERRVRFDSKTDSHRRTRNAPTRDGGYRRRPTAQPARWADRAKMAFDGLCLAGSASVLAKTITIENNELKFGTPPAIAVATHPVLLARRRERRGRSTRGVDPLRFLNPY